MNTNAIEAMAVPLATSLRTLDTAKLIASCANGDVWGDCAQYPKGNWRDEVEKGDTILGYWEWVFCQADQDGLPVEALRSNGDPGLVDTVVCRIVVTGAPSDPEDDGIPGEYFVEVTSDVPLLLAALSDGQKSGIAEAALDAWHDDHGVECLDDFVIEVFLPSGVLIDGETDAADGFSGSCL